MHVQSQNVNDAFKTLVRGIHDGYIPTACRSSRNGEVLQVDEPFILTYTHPRERVLFNKARDANPFFHLYESLWMLAGRNDVEPLAYYNSRMREFSDDGKTFNGAYGYRWRHSPVDDYVDEGSFNRNSLNGIDQLQVLLEHLHEHPESRRAVLQMWTVQDDLLKVGSPAEYSKDVCCNTCVYFSIRQETPPLFSDEFERAPEGGFRFLDMTVCNRSNDLIWGMLGANVVHFSFLQEYMANCLGVKVGVYHQITNNLHVYKERWEPEKWLKEYATQNWCSKCVGQKVEDLRAYVSLGRCDKCGTESEILMPAHYTPEYDTLEPTRLSLVKHQPTFDEEVVLFVEENSDSDSMSGHITWKEPFLDKVAQPMCHAFHAHKWRDYGLAYHWIDLVEAPDWRMVGHRWLLQRERAWNERSKHETCTH